MDKEFFKEEIIDNFRISKRRKKIWAVQLDLLEKFDSVCKKHKISYYIGAGTLLGAVKYKGFIPWDDDVDLYMFPEEYQKLLKISDQEFSEPYYLQSAEKEIDAVVGCIKLRNSNTTGAQFTEFDNDKNCGIWIDIGILYNLYSDDKKREQQISRLRFWQRILFAKYHRKARNISFGLDSYTAWYLRILEKIIPYSWLRSHLIKLYLQCKDEKYIGTLGLKNGQPILLREDFRESIQLDFEHLKLPAPSGYRNILFSNYGEKCLQAYPQKDKGIHHLCYFDTEIPYKQYIRTRNHFFEDIKGKRRVVFGAGKMAEYFLTHQGKTYDPECLIDNDSKKWGQRVMGYEIKSPDFLKDIEREDLKLVICSIYSSDIIDQINEMGFHEYYLYIDEGAWTR